MRRPHPLNEVQGIIPCPGGAGFCFLIFGGGHIRTHWFFNVSKLGVNNGAGFRRGGHIGHIKMENYYSGAHARIEKSFGVLMCPMCPRIAASQYRRWFWRGHVVFLNVVNVSRSGR